MQSYFVQLQFSGVLVMPLITASFCSILIILSYLRDVFWIDQLCLRDKSLKLADIVYSKTDSFISEMSDFARYILIFKQPNSINP